MPTIPITKDWKELLEFLNANQVKYLVVGGVALGCYVAPRYTGDIDIFIEASAENAKRMLRALDDFGFGSVGITEADLTGDDMIIQLGYPPNRIDFMTKISGVEFEEAWNNKVVEKIHELQVNLISKNDLLKNKLASGRPKDLADADSLNK